MKKLISFISAILLILSVYQVYAQENVWYSSSNFKEPQIIFTNPAGLSFREHRQAVFSSQLLFTGIANDKLYNHYLGYIEPIQDIGVFGVRGSHFNSHILNQNTISLLFSRFLIESKLSFGINVNLHQQSYDKNHFQLREENDPLLANGTSKLAFSAGLSLIFNPINDLIMGMSIDNFNQPDISLEGGKAKKPLTANLGVCYRIFNLVPELDVKYFRYSQRSETYFIFGLRQLLLDNSANLSVQFQQDCFSVGGAYTFKNFRLDYSYTYPFNELQEISNGSHQFTLSYNFGGYRGYSTAPRISLLSPNNSDADSSSFHFQAQVEDKQGLRKIKIQLNGQDFTSYDYTKAEKVIPIDIPVFPLREGENRIKIIASNDVKKSSKEIRVNYTAPAVAPIVVSSPKIEIQTPLGEETNSSSLRLKFSVEFIIELKDIKVKINDKDIQLKGLRCISKDEDKMNLEAELDLNEGINEIEVIAFNQRGAGSQNRTVRYNPIKEPFYNQKWAVIIGIDEYEDKKINDLNFAVKDAKSVENLIRSQFKFDHIIALYDEQATRDDILRAFSTDLTKVNKEDGIFIFFAGHGCTGDGIRGGPLGYIVPVDGTFDEKEFYVKNIPMSTIKEISQTIDAKHIYYVMDCCYGGLLLREGRMAREPSSNADYSYLKRLAKEEVRQVLTAGGEGQPVLDGGREKHSVFTARLIQGLSGEADNNQDGFITAEEINFFVRQRVHTEVKQVVRGDPILGDLEQTPQYGKWFGEGEFIFRSSSK